MFLDTLWNVSRTRHVCSKNHRDVENGRQRGTFPALAGIVERFPHSRPFSTCFKLCSEVVNMLMSHSCRVQRFVELRNIEMLLEVPKFLGPDTAGRCTAVRKDLTDLLACGVHEAFIIPMAFVMHNSAF